MYAYARSSSQSSFRADYPLSNDQLLRYAPSIMAEGKHESRGDRYAFIPTISVIDGLRREGFEPFEVRQTRTRDASKRAFTKHMVRLRHPDAGSNGEEVPELILLNSHDGSSSYQLLSGVFRFVCSNGLIAGDIFDDIRIRHSGDVVDNVIEGSYQVLNDTREIMNRLDTYKAITLTPQEQQAFAKSAIDFRWDDNAPVSTDSILRANRFDDRGADLWTTFNRVQENLLKGGVRGKASTGRRMTTKSVNGVTANVALNRALWTLADSMAQIKTGSLEPAELMAA
jgi:hypothetical protein